jgi:hypothetical protein
VIKTRIRRLYTFPLDDDLRHSLEAIREQVGIPVSVQIRRGIQLWLDSLGGTTRISLAKAGRKRVAPRKRP